MKLLGYKREMFYGLFMFIVLVTISAQVSVTGSLTHTIDSIPGVNYSRVITIRNDGLVPHSVRVYQTDYSFQADGRVFYNLPGTTPRSNAGWITLPVTTLTINPGEELPISYALRVPNSQNLLGTYWSVIMVESIIPGANPAEGINHIMRFAVQIINEFPGGYGSLTPIGARLDNEDGTPTLIITLENDGTLMLRPTVSVELYRRDGQVFGPFAADPRRMYPGTSAMFTLRLANVSAGDYRAIVLIDAEDENLFAIQYNLEVKN